MTHDLFTFDPDRYIYERNLILMERHPESREALTAQNERIKQAQQQGLSIFDPLKMKKGKSYVGK